jgi:hypothetical protein
VPSADERIQDVHDYFSPTLIPHPSSASPRSPSPPDTSSGSLSSVMYAACR